MNEKSNLENIKRCPRFEGCNIPKCPLDFYMSEREELKEDERCILITNRGSERVLGKVRGNLKRLIGQYVWQKNRMANISLPTPIV